MKTKLYILILIILIPLLTGCFRNKSIDTTGEKCESNADCYCRGFDGGTFSKEKFPGTCDPKTKLCASCAYR